MSYSIGVDLGGTNLRIAAVDENGTLLEKVTLGTQVQRGREFVISEMTSAIQSVTDKYSARGELVGIGIGVPGFIGFAVARTVFWDPVVAMRAGRMTRDQAVAEIARRYLGLATVYQTAAGG